MIPVGSLATDIAETNPGVARQAVNVLITRDAHGIAHGPHPSLVVANSATSLPDVPIGGVTAVNNSGLYFAFVGTRSAIHRMSAAYELDASTIVGSGYNVPDGDYWSFATYGPYLHATNTIDGMLQFNVDLDSSFSSVPDAPRARYVFSWADALFALDCDGENKVMRNSAIGNSLIWSGKGAGYRTFPTGEELMCGGALTEDYAIVLQRNSVNLLVRRSDGKLFDLKNLANDRGVVSPRAFCVVDGMAFWCDTDGFWQFSVAGGLKNIGLEKINSTFLKRLAANGFTTIELIADKANNRVVARYQRNTCQSETIFEDAYAYHYLIGEWAEIQETTAALFSMASPGYTLDDITPELFGDLDELSISLDSRFWSGGEPRMGALNGDLKFGYLDGPSLAAISETSSTQLGVSTLVNSVTPKTDAGNAIVEIGVRDKASDAIAWKDGVEIQPSGRCPVRGRGKLIAFRQTIAAGEDWSYLRGFDHLETSQGGAR